MNRSDLTDEQYGLLFSVRRSKRYHDRRRAFFVVFHRITSVLTFLLGGGVVTGIATGCAESPWWLVVVGAMAATLGAIDLFVKFAACEANHTILRNRFIDLETAMTTGKLDGKSWKEHHATRLTIEKDEPPKYHILDLLCDAETCFAEGVKSTFDLRNLNWFHKVTCHFHRWQNFIPKRSETKSETSPDN